MNNTMLLQLFISITTCILLISSFPSWVSGACSNKERDSLLIVKQSLGNPPSLSSWNATTDCCTWEGVSCDQETSKHVNALYIKGNKDVHGTLPPEFGNFAELYTISLENLPGLHGKIPDAIGNLTKLTFIYVSHTKLSGSIPASLGKLEIAHFDLHHCRLTGSIPPSITRIPTLRRLDLSHNLLSGEIPPFTLKQRDSLTELDLSYNKLSGEIPTSIGLYLTNLDSLHLGHNQLHGEIPSDLPTRLSKIDLGNNQLTGGIPESFYKLNQVLEIDLSRNQLEGDASKLFSINPDWIQSLNISFNNFAFDFGSVDKFATNFWSLDASHNQLFGVIPATLGSVRTMWTLYLSHNKLAGDIPSDRLPGGNGLSWVKLDHNNFTGKIPASLAKSGFSELDLSHNNFNGDASMLFNPDNINQGINLSWNELSFNLSSVAFSVALQLLDLSHNLIYGSIPPPFDGHDALEQFDVSYNLLMGKIPQGGKINSFNKTAFEHNLCLCGFPLGPCPCCVGGDLWMDASS